MRIGPEGSNSEDPAVPLPKEWHRRSVLRDGTPILLRTIRPSDREHLAAGLARLSPSSKYLRFHTVIDALTDEQLEYLTNVDHHDHEAVVAVDLTRPADPGIGVARFIREPFEPTVAEAAVTVADRYQARGAATALLRSLAEQARKVGIQRFRSYVLEGNAGMLDILGRLGADLARESDRLWRVDIQIPDVSAPGDELPRQKLWALLLERGRLTSVLPPVWDHWWRDRGHDDDLHRAPGDPLDKEFDHLRDELDEWLHNREDRD